MVVVGVPEKQPLGPSPELTHMPWLQTACAVLPVSNLIQSVSALHCTMSLSTITLHALVIDSAKANATLKAWFIFAITFFGEKGSQRLGDAVLSASPGDTFSPKCEILRSIRPSYRGWVFAMGRGQHLVPLSASSSIRPPSLSFSLLSDRGRKSTTMRRIRFFLTRAEADLRVGRRTMSRTPQPYKPSPSGWV